MKRFDLEFCARSTGSWDGIRADELLGFLRPKCKEILTVERLQQKLTGAEKLRVKFGIDPTGSDVHLGHIVPLMLLRLFAKAGHHIDLVIGDFTARIGDPTAREHSRDPLSNEQIAANLSTYRSQIGKYVDLNHLHVHHNAEWLSSLPLTEVFTIFQQISLSEAVQREDFRARMKNKQAVSLAEVCYGVLMGIDSVHLGSHVEIGGTDQLLNFQQCRSVMRNSGMEEEIILTTPILEGTSGDGKKMSKSYGNYIAVNTSLEDKFGKVMSLPDRLIGQYFRSFADVHERELDELERCIASDPLEAKKQLATLIVALEAGLDAGLRERESFERRFSQKDLREEDCSELTAQEGDQLVDVLLRSGAFKSKSALRHLFEQRAVRLRVGNKEETLTFETLATQVGDGIVRVGKRQLFKICSSEGGAS